jgi:hypothetical protein
VYRYTMNKQRGDAAPGPAASDAAVLATELALTFVSLGAAAGAPGGLKEAGGKEEAAVSFGSAAADSFLSEDFCRQGLHTRPVCS